MKKNGALKPHGVEFEWAHNHHIISSNKINSSISSTKSSLSSLSASSSSSSSSSQALSSISTSLAVASTLSVSEALLSPSSLSTTTTTTTTSMSNRNHYFHRRRRYYYYQHQRDSDQYQSNQIQNNQQRQQMCSNISRKINAKKVFIMNHYYSMHLVILIFLSSLCFTSEIFVNGNENNNGGGGDVTNGYSLEPHFSTTTEFDYAARGSKKFGDKCDSTLECGFPGSVCDSTNKVCQCGDDLPVTNHIDKCGKEASINDSCFFNEQCEAFHFQTECRDGRCICRFEMSPTINKDGTIECKGKPESREPERYIDPAMIGILAGMALMFIIICVVLRLFSRARWHENRTIFNTPNPRLMNVSLLRDSKLLHGQERRGSKISVRMPSRQPSMASLRPHSPNPSLGKQGSRRGSRGSSNASATSTRSNRSNGNGVPSLTTVNNQQHQLHLQQQQQQHQQHHPSSSSSTSQHHHHHHHNQHHQHGHGHDSTTATNSGGHKQTNKTLITHVPVIESVTVEVTEPKP